MNEQTSNCCNANMSGEPSNLTIVGSGRVEGRCADCGEMATFTTGILVDFIENTYPLGTTDGETYTIVPRQ